MQTDDDRAFLDAWNLKLKASYGKSQAVQNRVYREYEAALLAFRAARQREQVEAEVARYRAADAARKRAYRARMRAVLDSGPRDAA
jgi:hypothetical protein